jgi:hypothetical protein
MIEAEISSSRSAFVYLAQDLYPLIALFEFAGDTLSSIF